MHQPACERTGDGTEDSYAQHPLPQVLYAKKNPRYVHLLSIRTYACSHTTCLRKYYRTVYILLYDDMVF